MDQLVSLRFLPALALCGLLLILSFPLSAQLSPGELSKPHSHLEGMNNCTACHDLGDKVSQAKCLNCHAPLKEKIAKKRGYHVSSEVKGKSCITCHSEHHGNKFQMVRFNVKTFNHNLTGYALKGKHKVISCASCHTSSNIADKRLKNNNNTYLGLEPNCISCHDDYHKKSLGNDCARCHNFDAFKPATLFNHNKTDFPLTGAHAKVSCISCHKSETKNGVKFQNFANLSFKNCASCHKDPHNGSFGSNCKSCHSETSFHKIREAGFNHNITGFPLAGAHKTLDCASCHDNRAGPAGQHKEFAAIKNINCNTCHKDVHDRKFGLDCKKCHNEKSFRSVVATSGFDHDLTGFELEGKHKNIDCKKCHTSGNMTTALPYQTCNACHIDFHNGQFNGTPYTDCTSCHTVQGFEESLFSTEQHQSSAFPLTGAHLATACIVCHKSSGKWSFRNIGQACMDCHKNIHEGFMDPKYLPGGNCVACHNTGSWSGITFDHSKTNFQLTGRHIDVKCSSCHFSPDSSKKPIQKFRNLSTECVSCHSNIHGDQFDVTGKTDCNRCHAPDNWSASLFEHNTARFKLDGAHENLACNKCHNVEVVNEKEVVRYKSGKLECIDCHQ